MAEANGALDLRLGAREHVRIDGVTYDLAPLGSLGIRARAALARHVARIDEIEKLGEKATDEDEREYVDRMRTIAQLALPTAPAKVAKRLELDQLKAVVLTFFERGASSREFLAIQQTMRRLTSATSSQTSPASTARANGS